MKRFVKENHWFWGGLSLNRSRAGGHSRERPRATVKKSIKTDVNPRTDVTWSDAHCLTCSWHGHGAALGLHVAVPWRCPAPPAWRGSAMAPLPRPMAHRYGVAIKTHGNAMKTHQR